MPPPPTNDFHATPPLLDPELDPLLVPLLDPLLVPLLELLLVPELDPLLEPELDPLLDPLPEPVCDPELDPLPDPEPLLDPELDPLLEPVPASVAGDEGVPELEQARARAVVAKQSPPTICAVFIVGPYARARRLAISPGESVFAFAPSGSTKVHPDEVRRLE